jgi:hypothetical protein
MSAGEAATIRKPTTHAPCEAGLVRHLHAVSDRVLPAKGETMRCARFYGAHQPLRLEHIPPPEPTGDEV